MSDIEDADAISETLATAATSGVSEVAGDAGSTKRYSLSEMIEADKYLRAKAAAATSKRGGLRFIKLTPPGAV